MKKGKNMYVKKYFYIVLVLLGVTLLGSAGESAQAAEYYADLELAVNEDGSVEIKGITNDQSFSSGIHDEFTSKRGVYWLLNLSSNKNYSDYILSITLPEGAEFNYLKTEGRSRVSYDKGIRIIASGSSNLNIVVQYQVKDKHEPTFIFWFIMTIAGIGIMGFFSWKKFFKRSKTVTMNVEEKNRFEKAVKKEVREVKNKAWHKARNKVKKVVKKKAEKESEIDVKKEAGNEVKNEKVAVLKQTLNDNQVKVLELLIDAKGELTQKQLQHRSGLPKATLSRNIELLSKKNILIKQSRGLTNMIILSKEFLE
ncbi:MAG: helix-turn-helix transcriptional regulator [Candidatus Nanoarchaeia archaeon]